MDPNFSDCGEEDEFDFEYDEGDPTNEWDNGGGGRVSLMDEVKPHHSRCSDSASASGSGSLGNQKSVGFGGDYPFSILSTQDVGQYMLDCVQEAANVLQLPQRTMRILLRHFRWDQHKLLEAYYSDDSEDQAKFFEKARLVSPHKFGLVNNTKIIRNPLTSKEKVAGGLEFEELCQICFSFRANSVMGGIDCGHTFCSLCWRTYLRSKILVDGEATKISCPAHNCPILVDDDTVTSVMASEPKVLVKFDQLVINNFVQVHQLLRWCPGAGCSKAIRVKFIDWRRPVTCACGQIFCFQCGHQGIHFPVKCDWLAKWLKKCEDDSETGNWIIANTKDCPNCQVPIEKNGGCNHMICKTCQVEFCWVCMGPWKDHLSMRGYNCNRFDESETRALRDAAEKSRARLTRYLFYYNRYMSHRQSLNFEHKLYDSTEAMMRLLQEELQIAWIDVQFLKKAVDTLCQCRQMLMYTYAFAFSLAKTNQTVIFEDNQRDLEAATEKLSEYLERDLNSEGYGQQLVWTMDIKDKVQNLCQYCESRRHVVLEHVYEGYDKDWWVESDD